MKMQARPRLRSIWILLYRSVNGDKAKQLKKVFNTSHLEEFRSQAPTLG